MSLMCMCTEVQGRFLLLTFCFIQSALLAIGFLLNQPPMTTCHRKWPLPQFSPHSRVQLGYMIGRAFGNVSLIFALVECALLLKLEVNHLFTHSFIYHKCNMANGASQSWTALRPTWPMSQPVGATLRRGRSLPADDHGFTVKHSADSLFVVRRSMTPEFVDLLPLPSCYWHPDSTWPSFSSHSAHSSPNIA